MAAGASAAATMGKSSVWASCGQKLCLTGQAVGLELWVLRGDNGQWGLGGTTILRHLLQGLQVGRLKAEPTRKDNQKAK